MTNANPIIRRLAWVGVASALLLSTPFASAEEAKDFHLNDKVSEAIQKLKPLQDAKNYAGMMELVDGQLKNVPATSYDAAFLLDMKAKVFLQLEQYGKAIEPWEQALKLAQQYGYFDKKTQLDMSKFLSQLVFSDAQSVKDKQQQAVMINKAANYLKQYLQGAAKPEPEVQMLYAQILYFQATSDEKHINQEALKEARAIIERGMLTSIRPKESFYLLLLAVLQQQNDTAKSAEVMEVLLKQYPNKKDVWPMLFATYVNLAGGSKQDSRQQREYYIRAINTLERAQKLGFMNSQRDNYNLFTLYVNAGQIPAATDVLYAGLKKGAIESTIANWRTLSLYYQQTNKEFQAISALQEAAKIFPNDGSIEFLIGQNYQQLDRFKEAHEHYERAVKKGNLGDKPHLALLYLAYTAFELGDYSGALKAITDAANMPEGARDPQVRNLKSGIEATIQEQEASRAAREAAAKRF